MNIFLETFRSLFPLYFYLILGAVLRKTGIIPGSIEKPLNRIVFTVFLPAMLFLSVYNIDLAEDIQWMSLVFGVVGVIVIAVIAMIVTAKKCESKAVASVVSQSVYRTNFGVLGIVYPTLLYGADRIGPASMLIAVIVPVFNILGVINLELMRGGAGERPKISKILKGVITNPLNLAVLFALFFHLTGWKIPELILVPFRSIGDAAPTLAMILVGAAITLKGMAKNKKLIAISVGARLVLVPAIMIPLAVIFGFRDVTLLALMVAFGGPIASTLPAMAYEMGGDGELAAQSVAVSTVLSLFTLHILVVLLRTLGYA
ncbi:MAG: AEC family transporter [Saccharofermentanales bacterium]|jgi:predicted permease